MYGMLSMYSMESVFEKTHAYVYAHIVCIMYGYKMYNTMRSKSARTSWSMRAMFI